MINKNYKKAIDLSKKALTLVLAFIIVTISIPFTSFADSNSCNYYLIGNDFEKNVTQYISSERISRVDSPVDFDKHGKVLKRIYHSTTGASAGALLTYYEVLSEAYPYEELDHVKVNFDYMFDAKVGFITYFAVSPKTESKINYRVAGLTFKKDGTVTSAYNTTSNFNKYKNYELNKWYNYRAELNLKEDKISIWINNDLVCDNQPISITMQNFGERISNNVMTYRFDTSGGAESGANVYFDNWNYYVPYSVFYDDSTVELAVKNDNDGANLTAKGMIVNNERGVMLAASYKGNALQSAEIVDAENIDGILAATLTQKIEKGNFYRFFLLDTMGNIKPLVPSTDYKSYTEADYATIENKWREQIVGPKVDFNTLPSNVQSRISSFVRTGKSSYNTLQSRKNTLTEGQTYLDLEYIWDSSKLYKGSQPSLCLVYEFDDIFYMARACAADAQYPDQNLLTDDERANMLVGIREGLNWMYKNRYSLEACAEDGVFPHHKDGKWVDNWWNWFIGGPEHLLDALMCVRDDFTQEEIDYHLEFIKYLMNNYNNNLTNRDNVLERSYNDFGIGVITRDESMLFNIMNAYPILFREVTYDSGFYQDGSFLYHLSHPYTGVYGSDALLDRMVTVMWLSDGTAFQLPDYTKDVYMFWAMEAFAPLMYRGGMMNMVRGRAVDSSAQTVDGSFVLTSMLQMVDCVSEEDAYELKMFIKNQYETAGNSIGSLDVSPAITLDKIINDTTLPASEPYVRSKVFYNMDRIVHQMPTWSAGLAMSSERTSNYEALWGQNNKGWYNGDGMLYLYTAKDQFDTSYFKNADALRRPGTTEDNQPREAKNIAMEKGYFPEGSFVGGANMDDLYSVGAMDFIGFHNETQSTSSDHPVHVSDLVAKKSWFMFDDSIICLGSGINQTVAGVGEEPAFIDYNKVLYEQDFDDLTALPGEAVFNQKNVLKPDSFVITDGEHKNYVNILGNSEVPDGGSDLYFRLKFDSSKDPIYSNGGTVDDLTKLQISVDINPMGGAYNLGVRSVIGDYKKQNTVSAISAPNSEGKGTISFRNSDGTDAATYTYTKGEWITLNYFFDLTKEQPTYDAYVGDTLVCSGAKTSLTHIESFGVSYAAVANATGLYFDNLRIASDDGTHGTRVSTFVENRAVNKNNNPLTINGTDIPFSATGAISEGKIPNAQWAHIEGVGGYVFPTSGTGYNTTLNYRQNLPSNGINYTEMWFDHGIKPTNGKYAYAILPMMTKEQTASYAETFATNKPFEIIANTSTYHVVRHNRLGITGYVFWTAGSKEGVQVSAPVVLMKKVDGNNLEIAFSDPTQKLTDDLTITISGSYTKVSADAEIKSVSLSSGYTVVVAKMDGSDGKTIKLSLKK